MNRIGLVLFAIGLAGMGALSLIYQGFAFAWQPVTNSLPHREFFACLSGTILVVGGLALLRQRTTAWAAFALAAFVSSWLLLQLPELSARAKWVTFVETVMLACGGWILFASQADQKMRGKFGYITGNAAHRVFQLLFAFGLLVLSLSHFIGGKGATALIPVWVPFRLGLVYLTGIGHLAAGISILTGIIPRLATALEAIMIASFVLLVHVPLVVAQPSSHLQWTVFFFAIACSGASWIVASSFPKLVSKRFAVSSAVSA